MKFSKLQATGNDFILVDARETERDWTSLAQTMCQRHFGIGADGLILVQDSRVADLKMHVFNPDGSEAEACGNGLRCVVKYAIEQGIYQSKYRSESDIKILPASSPILRVTIETLSGIRQAEAYISENKVGRVKMSMGKPQFQPEQIPTKAKVDIIPILDYPLVVEGRKLSLSILSMGNPHAVSFTSEPVAQFPLDEVGPEIEKHPMFPKRTNFEIARVLSKEKIETRVWERGVGETLSCGSGACAIAVAAQLLHYANSKVHIMLPGGILTLFWDKGEEVLLSGAVEEVFTGEW
jgi:diaminopimelate epimerase